MMSLDLDHQANIIEHALKKYGDYDSMGWSPRRRIKYGYVLAGDVYEYCVERLVGQDTRWLDVGGGRSILPHNSDLSRELSDRCCTLTAVDPSKNVLDNPFAHRKVCALFEQMEVLETYNLITMRMVAEHVDRPVDVVRKLSSCLEPGGLVVIYTINKYCPIPLLTRCTPFSWHHKIKKVFWGGEEKDTFPVVYKMNSKKELDSFFVGSGEYEELVFRYLDDVSATIEFNLLNRFEMFVWMVMKKMGLRYLENNILAIYKRI